MTCLPIPSIFSTHMTDYYKISLEKGIQQKPLKKGDLVIVDEAPYNFVCQGQIIEVTGGSHCTPRYKVRDVANKEHDVIPGELHRVYPMSPEATERYKRITRISEALPPEFIEKLGIIQSICRYAIG